MSASPNGQDPLRAARANVYAERLQSLAVLRAENLPWFPVVYADKGVPAGQPETHTLAAWANIDAPDRCNVAALMPRAAHRLWVHVDIDVRPVERGDDLISHCVTMADTIVTALKEIGGIDCRYSFGRDSREGFGHVLVPVALEHKDDIDRLIQLDMRRAIRLGDIRLRIEIKFARSLKGVRPPHICLPGSVYRVDDGRHDSALELIRWQRPLERVAPDTVLPSLPPQSIDGLRRGLWAGLLANVALEQWTPGQRHDTALLLAGVLAQEARAREDGILDEDQAEALFKFIVEESADDEPRDRMACFQSTLRSSGPVTGYGKFAELVGEEAKFALLRMRGGGDPDALAALFDHVVYVNRASLMTGDAYADLSRNGTGGMIEMTREQIQRRFRGHPHYPAYRRSDGKPVELIDIVLTSTRLQRVDESVLLPGVPFGARIEEEGIMRLNVGRGFATPVPEKIDTWAEAEWRRLWRRHLKPLTSGNEAHMRLIEKAIAWAVQHPQEKIQLGVVLTGGMGIGKSALFDCILGPVLGSWLIGKTDMVDLDNQFRLADIDQRKLYVIEEANFLQAPVAIKELMKIVMKSDQLTVNRKYGLKGTVRHAAIPFFLTNSETPGILINGVPERTLLIIRGETRERLGLSLSDWRTYTNDISGEVEEFMAALKDPLVRQAAMNCFASLEVKRSDFNATAFAKALEDNDDTEIPELVRLDATPEQEAFFSLLETNCLHPRYPELTFTAPFRYELLATALRDKLRDRDQRAGRITPTRIGRILRQLFGAEVMCEAYAQAPNGKTQRLYYFGRRPADLVGLIYRNTGVRLVLDWMPSAEDCGPNEPTREQLVAAAALNPDELKRSY